MRTLSKLRHPCVTTVMGALVVDGCEPMMVMEHMDLGSLYAILHNETMDLDGETRYYLVKLKINQYYIIDSNRDIEGS